MAYPNYGIDWDAARATYESVTVGDPAAHTWKIHGRPHGITKEQIESQALLNGWYRYAEAEFIPGKKHKPSAPPRQVDPELSEWLGEMRRRITRERKVSPAMMPELLALNVVFAMQDGKPRDLQSAIDQAGRYKDIGAWREPIADPNKNPVQSATPEELKRLTAKLAETLQRVSPEAVEAIGSVDALLDGARKRSDKQSRSH